MSQSWRDSQKDCHKVYMRYVKTASSQAPYLRNSHTHNIEEYTS